MNNDIVKKGADFLLKGGTLLSEPCKICNGLLIKYKGDILCLNCQRPTLNQGKIENASDKIGEEDEKEQMRQKSLDKDNKTRIYDSEEKENYKDLLLQIDKTITKKIIGIDKVINMEEDTLKQKNNLKTLYLYLKIMDRIKKK
ncbi:MAG TPA: Sjogren's syndrome/scleroderma autoantigen 1 family protein [Phototrophicaceae bacterium]|nr:Sjogren's syndrome/scleroderma autoantigen 1 family protein [Phototrophicaceae bacterium]HYP42738.1 Sjogren's syndrome/scleroderma autoantigen 1 family protein [Candidatus Nitrosocosmicus sp.]